MEESGWSRGIKVFNLVNNHNVTNLHFTANKSTTYTSYYDKYRKWLWNHAWIFLFQNIFDQPALHDAVRINPSVYQSTSVDLAAYGIDSKSTMSMVQVSPLDLTPYVLVILTAYAFEFVEPFLLFFFQNFTNFCFRG